MQDRNEQERIVFARVLSGVSMALITVGLWMLPRPYADWCVVTLGWFVIFAIASLYDNEKMDKNRDIASGKIIYGWCTAVLLLFIGVEIIITQKVAIFGWACLVFGVLSIASAHRKVIDWKKIKITEIIGNRTEGYEVSHLIKHVWWRSDDCNNPRLVTIRYRKEGTVKAAFYDDKNEDNLPPEIIGTFSRSSAKKVERVAARWILWGKLPRRLESAIKRFGQ